MNAAQPYAGGTPSPKCPIIQIDCRGLEFVDFRPDGEWSAKGIETPTQFTAIDLGDGEWYDYDEKSSEEVSIKDIDWAIQKA